MRGIWSQAELLVVAIGIGACVAALAACVPQGEQNKRAYWVTPAGHPVYTRKCDGNVPSTTGGPDICEYRVVTKFTAAEQAACEADGGSMTMSMLTGPDGPKVCRFPTADEGKTCSKGSDCTIACDADSHQCRGISGLGAILAEDGSVVEVVE